MENYLKIYTKAMFFVYRQNVMTSKLSPFAANLYSDAYAYSIMHSIYPCFHEYPDYGKIDNLSEVLGKYPYFEMYDVPFEQVQEIAELLDNKMLNKVKITYYELEDMYRNKSWLGKSLRSDLINICRYFYLSNSFGEIWDHFMTSAPTEASGITRKFTINEVNSCGK